MHPLFAAEQSDSVVIANMLFNFLGTALSAVSAGFVIWIAYRTAALTVEMETNTALTKKTAAATEANAEHLVKVEKATNGLAKAVGEAKLEQGRGERKP